MHHPEDYEWESEPQYIPLNDEDPEEAELKFIDRNTPIESVVDGNNVHTHHGLGRVRVSTINGPAEQPNKTLKPKPKAPKAKLQTTKKDPKITKAHQDSLKEIGLNPPRDSQ